MAEHGFNLREKPTAASMMKEKADLEKLWGEAHAEMRAVDDMYFLRDDIWADLRRVAPLTAAKRPQYHSPRTSAVIDHAVDFLLAFAPQWHRERLGEGKEEDTAAGRVEKAVDAIMRHSLGRGVTYAPKVNGKQLARHNYTQLYVGLSSEALDRPVQHTGESKEDFQERESQYFFEVGAWNPFEVRVPFPGEVLLRPGKTRSELAIVSRKLRSYEIMAILGDRAKSIARKGGGEVGEYALLSEPYDEEEVIELITPYWWGMALGTGNLLYVEPNQWGFQPYLQKFVGDVDIPTGETFNPKWFVQQSLLAKVRDNRRFNNQLQIAAMMLISRKAYAQTIYDGAQEEGARLLASEILPGKPDQWGTLPVPEIPAGLLPLLETLSRDLNDSTYDLQAAGVRQEGVTTVGQQVQLSEMTSRFFQVYLNTQEELYSPAGGSVLRLAEVLAEHHEDFGPVVVDGHALRVADIARKYHIRAKFIQRDPLTSAQNKQMAMEELKLGVIDTDTYYQDTHREDPAAIRNGITRDKVRAMPEVAALEQAAALREAGYLDLADSMEQEVKARGLQASANGQPGTEEVQ